VPMSLFKSIERNLNNPLPIMGIAAVFDLSKLSCSEMNPARAWRSPPLLRKPPQCVRRVDIRHAKRRHSLQHVANALVPPFGPAYFAPLTPARDDVEER
jgi:hypothetical protein